MGEKQPVKVKFEELTPIKPNQGEDCGLQAQDVRTTWRVLNTLLRRSSANSDASLILLMGEVKDELREQLGYSVEREQRESELNVMKQKEKQKRAISRRRFLKIAVGILGPLAIPGGIGTIVYQRSFSPEANAKRAQEAKIKEEAQKAEREKIQKNVLGVKPSSLSYNDWKVSYPVKENGVEYVVRKGEENVRQVIDNGQIGFRVMGSSSWSGIFLSDFVKTDGSNTILLDVATKLYSDPPGNFYRIKEKWLLRDQPTDEIDTRVVLFQNEKSGEKIFLSISKVNSSIPSFEVRIMDKIDSPR